MWEYINIVRLATGIDFGQAEAPEHDENDSHGGDDGSDANTDNRDHSGMSQFMSSENLAIGPRDPTHGLQGAWNCGNQSWLNLE